MQRSFVGLMVIAGAAALLALSAGQARADDISGAGATFPYPVYAKWAEAYKQQTGIALNYQSIGSGGGIKQIEASTVTFGASDMPLLPRVLQQDGLVQWPMIIGGAIPVVNIPGIAPGQLLLDGPTIASIYLGDITRWND
ncbi:MAG: substrate-binding domain-containing protein, partial [Steroidobacteraceae bacterium]